MCFLQFTFVLNVFSQYGHMKFLSSLNEHKEIVHKDFKNKKQTPYEYSDIKLAEPLIITHQGLLQNTPRYRLVNDV